MQIVQAYQDDHGRLHKTKRDAVESEFISLLQEVWGSMPDQRDRGDPVVIARIIASSTYPMVRVRLREALDFLDEHLKKD